MVVTPDDYRAVAIAVVPAAMHSPIMRVELGARASIVVTVTIVIIPVAADADTKALRAGDGRGRNRDRR
jgi:hypothetical protein